MNLAESLKVAQQGQEVLVQGCETRHSSVPKTGGVRKRSCGQEGDTYLL
jgi:hypothetical protein